MSASAEAPTVELQPDIPKYTAFSASVTEAMLNPDILPGDKIGMLLPMLGHGYEGPSEFREFVDTEYGLTIDSIFSATSAGTTRPEDVLLQAGTDYAWFARLADHKRFKATVFEDEWQDVHQLPSTERVEQAQILWNRYEAAETNIAECKQDPLVANWLSEAPADELASIDAAPADIAAELLTDIKTRLRAEAERKAAEAEARAKAKSEAPTAEIEVVPVEEQLLEQASVEESQLVLFELDEDDKPLMSDVIDEPVTEELEVLPGSEIEADDIADETPMQPKGFVQGTFEHIATSLQGTSKGMAAVAVISAVGASLAISHKDSVIPSLHNGNTPSETNSSGKNAKIEVGLGPGKLNPSVEVTAPSQVAKDLYHLSPDTVIPKHLKNQLLRAAISSARTSVRTMSATPSIIASEPSDSRLNRSDPIVRNVDELALHAIRRLKRDQSLTPAMLDQAVQDAAKAMMAVRFPKTMQGASAGWKPETAFQQKLAGRIADRVFRGHVPVSEAQQQLIAGLIAKAVGEVTPKIGEREALSSMVNKADKLAGIETALNNPVYRVDQIIAAISMLESGVPADPKADNGKGYYGPWQMYRAYWSEWAGQFLGNPKAPMNIDNMTIVAAARFSHLMDEYGSAEAAMAVWLKGWAVGKAIAGSDKVAYGHALKQADGNATSVGSYLSINGNRFGTVNVGEQLPFLEGIKRRHPHLKKILEKEYPRYSKQTMREKQARLDHRRRVQSLKKQHRLLSASEQKKIGYRYARVALREYKRYGDRNLEIPPGSNRGPIVRKYTKGRVGPWCAWFVSYTHEAAGRPFWGSPASPDRTISLVRNEAIWYKQYGALYGNKSRQYHVRVGDTVLYNADDGYTADDHTGVVVKVKGDFIGTVEGNTSPKNAYSSTGGAIGYKYYNSKRPPSRHIAFGRVTRR